MKKIVAVILVALSHSYVQTMDNSVPVILTPRSDERVKNYILATMPLHLYLSETDAINTGDLEIKQTLAFLEYPEYHATLRWTNKNGESQKVQSTIPYVTLNQKEAK